MALPAQPLNFFAQQGNAQVFLSWANVVGATSYQVMRSSDGVNFTSLATTAVPMYLDASVSPATQYFYQVAGVNSSGTGSLSSVQSVIPTLSGQLSLGELRLRSQQRADRVGSNFVTMPEWNFFINQAYYELYDLLITVYEDYYVAPRLSFLTTSAQLYALPDGGNYAGAPGLYKLYGVDLGLDSSSNAFVSLKKFEFIERNRYVYPQSQSVILGSQSLQYRLVGGSLMLIPPPASAQTVGLWYYPKLKTLLADTDVMDGISGWTQYVIVRAAKYALDKEEGTDTSKLDAEIMMLGNRVNDSAQNRDAGQPSTISNTRGQAGSVGIFGGSEGWS